MSERRNASEMMERAREAHASFVARQAVGPRKQPTRKQELKASTALCWPGGVQFGGFHSSLQV